MKLVAVMPVWQRYDLTALILRQWYQQIHRLRGQIDLHLVVVGSEGVRSSALVSGYSDGMSYAETDNAPLNRKWNVGLEVARYLDPDAVLTVGSDDLVSDSLLFAYAAKLKTGLQFFGLTDLYFFDAASLRLGHWPGYGPARMPHRAGEPIGCARAHGRAVLERVGWRLWPDAPARNNSMDFASFQHLAAHGFQPQTFTLAELGAKSVDIKVGAGVTTYARIPYATEQRGAAALRYLSDLVDEPGLQQLTTRWRAAA